MKKYIEKEAFKQYLLDLKKQVNEVLPGQSVISGTTLSELIDRFPAADVVEGVRCKDCKHRDPDDQICKGRGWPMQAVPDNGFCDQGRLRE